MTETDERIERISKRVVATALGNEQALIDAWLAQAKTELGTEVSDELWPSVREMLALKLEPFIKSAAATAGLVVEIANLEQRIEKLERGEQ